MVYIACMGMGIIYAVMPFVTDLTIVMVMGVGTNASCISFAHTTNVDALCIGCSRLL